MFLWVAQIVVWHRNQGNGMDAVHAAIVDLVWDSNDPNIAPTVNIFFESVADHDPDPGIQDLARLSLIAERQYLFVRTIVVFIFTPANEV